MFACVQDLVNKSTLFEPPSPMLTYALKFATRGSPSQIERQPPGSAFYHEAASVLRSIINTGGDSLKPHSVLAANIEVLPITQKSYIYQYSS